MASPHLGRATEQLDALTSFNLIDAPLVIAPLVIALLAPQLP
ncbi:MAG: hypothetical protein EDM05_047200 [Leptolyngbya sp. IPPAS B-1204]